MALLTNINGKFSVSDAGAVTFNNAFTFPTADGNANYVLQTNGSGQIGWAANGSVTGSGSATRVAFWSSASAITSDADLYWDNTNNRLGIGTDSPDTQLHIYNSDTNWGAYSIITLGTDVEGTNEAELKYYRGAATATESFQLAVRGTTALTALYNGNVGIGTVLPGAKLEVSDGVGVARISGTTGSSAAGQKSSSLEFWSADPSAASGSSGARVRAEIFTNYETPTGSISSLNFATGNGTVGGLTNRMRIDSSGQLNLTSGTYHKLAATFPSTYETVLQIGLQATISAEALSDTITFAHSGTEAVSDYVFKVAGNPKLIIKGNGNVGIGTTTFAPTTNLQLKMGNMGSGVVGEIFDAVDNADNSRIIICGGGIGTPQFSMRHYSASYGFDIWMNTSSPWDTYFDVRQQTSGFRWRNYTSNNGGEVDLMTLSGVAASIGTLTVKGDVVAYGSPSDKRLKENIKPIESALDKVSKLQGVTFDWKESDSILDIKKDIGFIAQDVQKVIPELVRKSEGGMLSMRHQGIAPILLEAIKELKAEIEELKLNKCNCNCNK